MLCLQLARVARSARLVQQQATGIRDPHRWWDEERQKCETEQLQAKLQVVEDSILLLVLCKHGNNILVRAMSTTQRQPQAELKCILAMLLVFDTCSS